MLKINFDVHKLTINDSSGNKAIFDWKKEEKKLELMQFCSFVSWQLLASAVAPR
jgi:hypothetical protein